MINKVLERLSGVKKSGADKWLAKCPAHDDRSPSLGIKLVDDKILVHCFAGCSVDDIVQSIGLEISDLFPEKTIEYGAKAKRPPKFNASELIQLCSREACVLSLGLMDCFNGKVISDVDRTRLLQAMKTISSIKREVSR
ncbi:hypothetical protein A1359_07905 [Methylomonas lenta]|uniref:Zinc finger CHC2-type domain-containing protein n=1 Tax=Methylomonas lenta TaxID=980561 RepID=A0A177NFD1_9GAMM|nr:CHC2 zinc finger domain-containing protein [Methylomonas lenta]OAI16561.1 hypothetical protein A1359_07905 [Methylomonas lenta]